MSETHLIGAIIALAGAVATLFAWFKSNYTRLEGVIAQQAEALAERDEERAKLTARLIELERRVGWIESCPAADCPFRRRPVTCQPASSN